MILIMLDKPAATGGEMAVRRREEGGGASSASREEAPEKVQPFIYTKPPT